MPPAHDLDVHNLAICDLMVSRPQILAVAEHLPPDTGILFLADGEPFAALPLPRRGLDIIDMTQGSDPWLRLAYSIARTLFEWNDREREAGIPEGRIPQVVVYYGRDVRLAMHWRLASGEPPAIAVMRGDQVQYDLHYRGDLPPERN